MHIATDAARLLLITDVPRVGDAAARKVRRYRLARLRPDAARRDEEPRYAYLKRSYD